jgi:hypothetical protein
VPETGMLHGSPQSLFRRTTTSERAPKRTCMATQKMRKKLPPKIQTNSRAYGEACTDKRRQ